MLPESRLQAIVVMAWKRSSVRSDQVRQNPFSEFIVSNALQSELLERFKISSFGE
jgi:hypothetical protein